MLRKNTRIKMSMYDSMYKKYDENHINYCLERVAKMHYTGIKENFKG